MPTAKRKTGHARGAPNPKCSFCGAFGDQDHRLVAGPGVFICEQCTDLSWEVIGEINAQARKSPRAETSVSARMGTQPRHPLAHCSFCGKSQEEVARLVAGPGVYICDGCVELTYAVLTTEHDPVPARHPLADDPAALIAQLRQAKATFDQLNESLRPSVDKLRALDISWARIGEALGMSRQAAWERFSGED